MCAFLEGSTERCVLSFVDLYRKNRGSGLREASPEIMHSLVRSFAESAAGRGISLQTCCEAEDFSGEGVPGEPASTESWQRSSPGALLTPERTGTSASCADVPQAPISEPTTPVRRVASTATPTGITGQPQRTAPATTRLPLSRSLVKKRPEGPLHHELPVLRPQDHPVHSRPKSFPVHLEQLGPLAEFFLDGVQHLLFRQGPAQLDIGSDDHDVGHLG